MAQEDPQLANRVVGRDEWQVCTGWWTGDSCRLSRDPQRRQLTGSPAVAGRARLWNADWNRWTQDHRPEPVAPSTQAI